MTKYWLFQGLAWYPEGGIDDWAGCYESIEDAKDALDPSEDWAHIATLIGDEMVVVARYRCGMYGAEYKGWKNLRVPGAVGD